MAADLRYFVIALAASKTGYKVSHSGEAETLDH